MQMYFASEIKLNQPNLSKGVYVCLLNLLFQKLNVGR